MENVFMAMDGMIYLLSVRMHLQYRLIVVIWCEKAAKLVNSNMWDA